MAIEPAPVEINLREPRKRGRDFSALLWLCGWGAATAVALSALAITSQTQTATDRLRSIFAVSEPSAVAQMPPRVAQLELEAQMLTAQVRALNADRDRLAGRIALLESSVDDMTGAIKRQAAATAAALAARTGIPRIPAAAEPRRRLPPRPLPPQLVRLQPKPIPSSPHLSLCRQNADQPRRRPPGLRRRPARASSASISAAPRRSMACSNAGRP